MFTVKLDHGPVLILDRVPAGQKKRMGKQVVPGKMGEDLMLGGMSMN